MTRETANATILLVPSVGSLQFLSANTPRTMAGTGRGFPVLLPLAQAKTMAIPLVKGPRRSSLALWRQARTPPLALAQTPSGAEGRTRVLTRATPVTFAWPASQGPLDQIPADPASTAVVDVLKMAPASVLSPVRAEG